MEPPMRGPASRDIRRLPTRRNEDAVTLSVRRISWPAALAGTAIGLVLQLWLSMLGVAIGVSAIDPLKEAVPMMWVGPGSLIWQACSIVVSSFIGGWISGRLAGIPKRLEAMLHGAISWACANILTFAVISGVLGTPIGMTVSGTTGGLVIMMFLGLWAGLAGASLATPRNPLVRSRRF
jgi:hypothetical protein